jgi:hypothetical protein
LIESIGDSQISFALIQVVSRMEAGMDEQILLS